MAFSAPDECCITGVLKEPVQILSIGATSSLQQQPQQQQQQQQPSSDLQRFFDDASLDEYLGSSSGQNYSCRFISICQRNSWRPLQLTSSMLALLINKHGLSANIRDLTSCYYTKNNDLEDSFCAPFTLSTDGPWLEILYTIRYPEFKESESEWSIRQTGICHRINTETRQTIILLLGPKPNSKSHQIIYDYLMASTSQYAGNTWFEVHYLLLKAHLPAWRAFNKACEAEFLPISNDTFATYIDEPLRVGYDHLSTLSSLQARFLKITSLIASTTELVDELLSFLQSFPDVVNDHRLQNTIANNLNNHRRNCVSYLRSANFLKERVQVASQLLANTLSYRDQVIANEQNSNMLQLNKSAVFITTLTLIYAPASFVATFFGMNFFAMDQPNSQIVCTAMIWIYIVTTLVFTIVTVIFYYWLLRHDGVLFGRLAPKVPVNRDWKGFVRRFTKLDNSVEMQPYNS